MYSINIIISKGINNLTFRINSIFLHKKFKTMGVVTMRGVHYDIDMDIESVDGREPTRMDFIHESRRGSIV
jgi:hypothetical protein